MATIVINPDIKEFVDLLGTQSSDHFSIREVLCNKPLNLQQLNAWQQTGATVLGIKTETGEYQLNPLPGTVVAKGQRLIVMGSTAQIHKLKELT